MIIKPIDDESKDITSICIDCLNDEVLKKRLEHRQSTKCVVCERSEYPSVDSVLLAKISRNVISDHFQIYEDIYPGYNGLSLSKVVGKVIGCDNPDFCDVVASHLTIYQDSSSDEEEFFGEDQEYSARVLKFDSQEEEQDYLVSRWDSVAFNLVHRQRYFNEDAEQFFKSLFEAASTATHNTLFEGNKPAIIKEHKAGFELYRARKVSGVKEKEKENIMANPNTELGAPPKEVTTHNRMNSTGIPFFYSAREEATCIAEIRPSIGDEIAVGKFKITKDLKFFDFHGLDYRMTHPKGSYFHANYEERKHFQALLSYLHNAISQPVNPDGNGYIVTQAMAEYLHYKHEEKLDGIIFKSVQEEKGVNYVIFNESGSVFDMNTPKWQPPFPVENVGKPRIFKVDSIKYGYTAR